MGTFRAERCRVVPLLVITLTACMETSGSAPLRSPSTDYRPAPPTTSDGEVVGVDRKAPADKLAEGPTNGRAAPGWKIGPKGVSFDRRELVGGEIDRSDSQSPAAAPTTPPPAR